jgi:hypothetical protein
MVALGIGAFLPPIGAHSQPAAAKPMNLGYVELEDDPRYPNRDEIDGIVFSDLGRPYEASQVALEDARAIGRVTKVEFTMEKATRLRIILQRLGRRKSEGLTMRGLWFCLLMLAGTVMGIPTAKADEAPRPAALERTDAFDTAYAASFHEFDACGDELSGRIYRSALVEKLRQCPFAADAKRRFQARSAAQRQKWSEAMAKLIEDNGGLPVRLEVMTRTCREQSDTAEYRQVRGQLDDYAAGRAGLDAVVAEPCDAAKITP